MRAKLAVKPEDFFTLPVVAGVSIDARGCAAYALITADPDKDAYCGSIRTFDLGSKKTRIYTRGIANDRSPQWSTDGRRLLFLSDRSASTQVWLIDADGGEGYPAPESPGNVSEATFSPDGTRIAAVVAPSEETKEIEKRGWRRIGRMRYRADGVGYFDALPRLWLLDLRSNNARPLTDGSGFVSAPSWSPDCKRLCFAGEHRAEADSLFKTELWVVDVDAETAPRKIHTMAGALDTPVWSPDGKSIAFCAHDEPAGWSGLANLRLYTVDATGGNPRCWTPNAQWTCANLVIGDVEAAGAAPPPQWLADGSIAVLGSQDGAARVFKIDQTAATALTPPSHSVSAFAVASSGEVICCASDSATPPELYRASASKFERLTNETQSWVDGEHIKPAERQTIDCPAGGIDVWRLQGIGATPRPAVLQIHGGPHFAYGNTFLFEFQLLAAAGYDVIYCNPRGSQSYGEPFARAIIGNWATPAFDDCMAALDVTVAAGDIDAGRLGVAGGSYGGYLTCWAIGHTKAFKAAVAMRSATNLTSLWGTSEVGRFLTAELGGRPDEIPQVYRDNSPLTFAGAVSTPVLLIHSERDYRCPIEQSEQFFTALKERGREVELLRFLYTDHGLSRTGPPRARIARLEAILDWFSRHLK